MSGGRSSAFQAGQAVLGGDGDGLVERADGRRVDVLHAGQVLEGDPRLHRHGQEVGPLLDALAADHLGADEPQAAGLGQQLDLHLLHARVVAGPGDPLGHAQDERDAEGGGQRLAERHPADHPLAGDHAPGDVDRLVGPLAAGGVGAGHLALGVGVAAGEALDRDVADGVGQLGAVAGGVHAGPGGGHVLVDDDPAGRSDPHARGRGQGGVGHLLGAHHHQVGGRARPTRCGPP